MKYNKEIYGKNGVLSILGNPQETMLFLNYEPIQYSWFAEVGSTWRYHIAKGITENSIKKNKEIDRIVNSGISNYGEFLAVAEYYSNFLNYGNYEFGYYKLTEGIYMTHIPKSESYASFDYYGGCMDFSSTQIYQDEQIINEYVNKINYGATPSMILLHIENSAMFYILDGHHKFIAYGKAKRCPQALIITKKEQEYKSIEYSLELLSKMGCYNENYISWIKTEKSRINEYKNKILNLDEWFNLIKYE